MCEGTHGFIPANGVFNFKLIFDQYGQKMMNNFNVLSGGGVLQADMDRIQLKLLDWLTANWKPASGNTASCSLMVGQYIGVEGGIQKDYVVSPAVVGTVNTGAMPANVTFCAKWGTGFAGRSARGRTFHIGLTSGNVSGNTLIGASVTAFVAVYTALLTKLGAGGTVDKLVVTSYCNNGFWRINASSLPVTGVSIEANLDSQRRRLTGRGM